MRRSKHNFGELLPWLSPSTIRVLGIKLRLLGKGSMGLYSLRHFAEPKISFKVMNNGAGDSCENMPIPVWGPLRHDKHVLRHGRTWEVSFSPSSSRGTSRLLSVPSLHKHTCSRDLLFQRRLWKDRCHLCYWLYTDVAEGRGEFPSKHLQVSSCTHLPPFRTSSQLILSYGVGYL